MASLSKNFDFNLKSYERHNYESVDEKSLSGYVPKKLRKTNSGSKGLSINAGQVFVPIHHNVSKFIEKIPRACMNNCEDNFLSISDLFLSSLVSKLDSNSPATVFCVILNIEILLPIGSCCLQDDWKCLLVCRQQQRMVALMHFTNSTSFY